MKCPKCGSTNVNVNVVTEAKTVRAHHSILWWLFFGWYWIPIKWLFFTLPAIFVQMFGKKKKVVTKTKTLACCQNCGNTWKV